MLACLPTRLPGSYGPYRSSGVLCEWMYDMGREEGAGVQTVMCTWSRKGNQWDFEAPAATPAHPKSGIFRHYLNPESSRTLCGHSPRLGKNWRVDDVAGLEVHCAVCRERSSKVPAGPGLLRRPESGREVLPQKGSGLERRLNALVERRKSSGHR